MNPIDSNILCNESIARIHDSVSYLFVLLSRNSMTSIESALDLNISDKWTANDFIYSKAAGPRPARSFSFEIYAAKANILALIVEVIDSDRSLTSRSILVPYLSIYFCRSSTYDSIIFYNSIKSLYLQYFRNSIWYYTISCFNAHNAKFLSKFSIITMCYSCSNDIYPN